MCIYLHSILLLQNLARMFLRFLGSVWVLQISLHANQYDGDLSGFSKVYLVATNDIALVLELVAVVLGGHSAGFHFIEDLTRVFLGLLRRARVVEVSLCEITVSNDEDRITKQVETRCGRQ